jgi:adenylate cyclase
MMVVLSSNHVATPRSARAARLVAVARLVRARARLVSALVLLSFVLCHLLSHVFLIVSPPLAEQVLGSLMMFWWSDIGTYVLATALAVHVLNALWSIYIRRYLRLPIWELAQLGLGLSIPPLLMLHIVGTKISDRFLGTSNTYHSVLTIHWVVTPWLVYLQFAAVLTLWVHACIGLHFWLRTKRRYPVWLPILGMVGVLIPALALAGYVSGGNQILREAQDPGFLASIQNNAHETPETVAQVWHLAFVGLTIYAGLVLLPFAGQGCPTMSCSSSTSSSTR